MADRPRFSIRSLLLAVAIMAVLFATTGYVIRLVARHNAEMERRQAEADRQLKADVASGRATVYPDGTIVYFEPYRLRPD